MRIAFTRWRYGGLLNRPSPRKRLLAKKKTSSGFEFVSGLADGASAMPAKWSRPVFSFRLYEGKISRCALPSATRMPSVLSLIPRLRATSSTFRLRAHESTLDAELNDFGAQLAMLGGHAADSDGQAEAARPGTARIEKECAVLCLDLGPVRMTIDHRVDVCGGLGVKLGENV